MPATDSLLAHVVDIVPSINDFDDDLPPPPSEQKARRSNDRCCGTCAMPCTMPIVFFLYLISIPVSLVIKMWHNVQTLYIAHRNMKRRPHDPRAQRIAPYLMKIFQLLWWLGPLVYLPGLIAYSTASTPDFPPFPPLANLHSLIFNQSDSLSSSLNSGSLVGAFIDCIIFGRYIPSVFVALYMLAMVPYHSCTRRYADLHRNCVLRAVAYKPLSSALERLPWPDGHSRKLFALAASRRTGRVRKLARLQNDEDDETALRRHQAIHMHDSLSAFSSHNRDIFEEYQTRGADLDFPDALGHTGLIFACERRDVDSAHFLLHHGSKPNLQTSTDGDTALHRSVYADPPAKPIVSLGDLLNSAYDNVYQTVVHSSFAKVAGKLDKYQPHHCAALLRALLLDARTDPCVLNHRGETFYMSIPHGDFVNRNEGIQRLMRPSPSFTDMMHVASATDPHAECDAEALCAALRALVANSVLALANEDRQRRQSFERSLRDLPETSNSEDAPQPVEDRPSPPVNEPQPTGSHKQLRVMDMLFCAHEGDEPTLARRRIDFFERVLRPLVARAAREPKMARDDRALIVHLFEQSAGPPQLALHARTGYRDAFDSAMREANASIESLYGEELDALLAKPDSESLFSLVKKESKLSEHDLNHGRFTAPPAFVHTRDLAAAARELQRVGVLDSPGALCDLLQQGRHRLFPNTALPNIFGGGVQDDDFWMALVLLWSLGVHEQCLAQFNAAMRAVAPDAFHSAPGVKGFERSLEKAKEYAVEKRLEGTDKLLAPLHVVDGLRCSFTVDTMARNLELGRALEATFPAARKKNGHQKTNRSYADRKLNLVVGPFGPPPSEFMLLCEVQILMRRYIEIKQIGHLLYEFQR